MIIDCHGHYTTSSPKLQAFRDEQLGLFSEGKDTSLAKMAAVSDDEIIDSIENNQLKLIKERGGDMTIFSPKASAMGQHQADLETSIAWARESNDLIHRVCELFPKNFAPGCQLPQEGGQSLGPAIDELRRCIGMGFVGFNLNPDPSGGHWTGKPLTDPYWYPLYEIMCDLDVPAMIHVSGACHPAMHTTSSFYLGADTTAFVHFMMSDVFTDFPSIKFIIPHGGGAVPYHWGRFRGMAQDMGLGDLNERVLGNIFFDTCVYHQEGIDMLTKVIPTENILFASEMIGAVRGIDPRSGYYYDDTKRYIDSTPNLDEAQRKMVFEGNARRVFSRFPL